MKVVIVGGKTRTDFLIESLEQTAERIVVINNDRAYCEYLSSRHENAEVLFGDGTKRYVLEDGGIEGFDLVIALTNYDADNLVIAQLARHFFGIRHQICTVSNPRNIAVFRKLGVTAAISGTSTIAQAIERASIDAVESSLPNDTFDTASMKAIDDELANRKDSTSSFHRIGRI